MQQPLHVVPLNVGQGFNFTFARIWTYKETKFGAIFLIDLQHIHTKTSPHRMLLFLPCITKAFRKPRDNNPSWVFIFVFGSTSINLFQIRYFVCFPIFLSLSLYIYIYIYQNFSFFFSLSLSVSSHLSRNVSFLSGFSFRPQHPLLHTFLIFDVFL